MKLQTENDEIDFTHRKACYLSFVWWHKPRQSTKCRSAKSAEINVFYNHRSIKGFYDICLEIHFPGRHLPERHLPGRHKPGRHLPRWHLPRRHLPADTLARKTIVKYLPGKCYRAYVLRANVIEPH
jgi:hypothetical protein